MMAGGGMKITDAINSIPEKKEKLRKAFEALQSSDCSSLFSLPDWKDVDDHFSALEKSIHDQFKSLPPSVDKDRITIEPLSEDAAPAEALKMITPKAEDLGDNDNADEEASPRPELRSLCVSMDGKGLLSYIYENRKEIEAIKKELGPALRCAPNPALLVLNTMQEFYPPPQSDGSKRKQQNKRGRSAPPRDRERENKEAARTHFNQGTCVTLLDKLHLFSHEIDPSIKEMAKDLALKWKARIHETGGGGGGDALEAMGLLQLISSYHLLTEFTMDDVLELFSLIARRRLSINIFRTLGLSDKLPDLIQKLKSKGRQIDAIKFIYAFNAVEQYPPVPLLKAYITESKKVAQEVRTKGKNSVQAQNEAIAKELGAVKAVLKVVEEYKLETEYPHESLVKRITQLEKQAPKKRTTTAVATLNSKPQLQQQLKKRPRQAAVNASGPFPPLIQTQSRLSLSECAPYIASVYNQGGIAMGHVGVGSSPRSYYPSESLVGTSSLYGRQVTYTGHPLSSLPSSYGSSKYP